MFVTASGVCDRFLNSDFYEAQLSTMPSLLEAADKQRL
jgi:hypothetical protein